MALIDKNVLVTEHEGLRVDCIDFEDVKEALNNFYNEYWKVSYEGDKYKKHITCDELDYLMAKHFGDIVEIKTLQDLSKFGDFDY